MFACDFRDPEYYEFTADDADGTVTGIFLKEQEEVSCTENRS